MRFFINIIIAGQLIGDPEGDDFANYAEAQGRALRCGRELVANWLLQDKSIPSQSFIQIADADGRIVETLPLDGIALGRVPRTE